MPWVRHKSNLRAKADGLPALYAAVFGFQPDNAESSLIPSAICNTAWICCESIWRLAGLCRFHCNCPDWSLFCCDPAFSGVCAFLARYFVPDLPILRGLPHLPQHMPAFAVRYRVQPLPFRQDARAFRYLNHTLPPVFLPRRAAHTSDLLSFLVCAKFEHISHGRRASPLHRHCWATVSAAVLIPSTRYRFCGTWFPYRRFYGQQSLLLANEHRHTA